MTIVGPTVQIVIQKKTSTSDGMGGYKDVYSTRYTIYVGFHSLTAEERLLANRDAGVITNRVFMDYYSDISLSDQITYNGNTYQIIAVVDPAQAHEHLELDIGLIV